MKDKTAPSSRTIKLEGELRVAAGVTETAKMQDKWSLVDVHSGPSIQCLCGQAIRERAVLEYEDEPRNRVTVGLDCAQKVMVFNQTGKLVTVTQHDVSGYRGAMWKYINGLLNLQGRQYLSVKQWLLDLKVELPAVVDTAIKWLHKAGFPPTELHAKALATYYRSHRLFELKEMLSKEERVLFIRYAEYLQLPKEVTLVQLDEIKTQLGAAEADLRLRWERVCKRLQKGVPVTQLSYFRFEFGWVRFVCDRIGIVASTEHSTVMAQYYQATMPAELRIAQAGEFVPREQLGYVQFDRNLIDAWHERARTLQTAEDRRIKAEHEKAAQEAEDARRERLKSLCALPIPLTGQGLRFSRRLDGKVELQCTLEGAAVRAELVWSDKDPELWSLTRPTTVQATQVEYSEDCRRIVITLADLTMIDWQERVIALFLKRTEVNSAELTHLELVAKKNGQLREMEFKFEVTRAYPEGWWSCRLGTTKYWLSLDDSYKEGEGKISVWVGGEFHRGSRIRKVHRVERLTNLNGTVSLAYTCRPRGRHTYPVAVITANRVVNAA